MTDAPSSLTTPYLDPERVDVDVVVVGAGQAGLALAWHLADRGHRFVVLDAGPEVGHVWRNRWDSLRLFTPAQYDALPGLPFPAPPDTYPTKDEVADYLADYADRFRLPVLLNTVVTSLEKPAGDFVVRTTGGTFHARQVVVATGPFQEPVVPAVADGLGPAVAQVHSAEYRNPDQLPDGPVVVVGAGNSGMQIAQELAATRPVTLAVGTRSPELPQRVLGRDLFWWLTRLGVLTRTPDSLLARRMRSRGDLVIGSSLEALRLQGVTLGPRVVATSVDAVQLADGRHVPAASVIWATGFRSEYSWIDVPGALRDGQPVHRRGVCDVPGLYFLGLPWQHTRGSALLGFVKHDAQWLADRLAGDPGAASAPGHQVAGNPVVSPA